MKVIAKGDGKKKWTKRFVCEECKAVLEVEEKDLHVANTAVAYAGESWEPRLYFDCAVCHSDNDVTGKVPSGIQSKLFEEAREKSN